MERIRKENKGSVRKSKMTKHEGEGGNNRTGK